MIGCLRERQRQRERGRQRERWEVGHSEFYLSDLLMIALYFGDKISFSLTRHFDGQQVPGIRPKNLLMSL